MSDRVPGTALTEYAPSEINVQVSFKGIGARLSTLHPVAGVQVGQGVHVLPPQFVSVVICPVAGPHVPNALAGAPAATIAGAKFMHKFIGTERDDGGGRGEGVKGIHMEGRARLLANALIEKPATDGLLVVGHAASPTTLRTTTTSEVGGVNLAVVVTQALNSPPALQPHVSF